MKQCFTIFVLCLFYTVSRAQLPELVKDINSGFSSSIVTTTMLNSFAGFNGKVYFRANGGEGMELWVTDGTEAGTVLVKDIRPGSSGSDPQNFHVGNGYLFFTANDGTNGKELWRTDGTENGTVMVKDIQPGSADGIPNSTTPNSVNEFYVWNDVLYFTANDGVAGNELWRSDGTDAGTYLLKDLNPFGGLGSANFPAYFTEYNGKLYFSAPDVDQDHGKELWVTDGTPEGTMEVKDIQAGFISSFPRDLIVCNGYLLFIADGGFNQGGLELWRSDGTPDGTVRVKDINANGSGLNTMPDAPERRLVRMGDVIYFSADDGVNGRELWRSDGTEAGTYMVKDASQASPGYAPQNLTVNGNMLFYRYNDGEHGLELWRSDGTEQGTVMVKDIVPGSNGSMGLASSVFAFNGVVFFNADDGTSGNEFWQSNGTEAGTVLVADLNDGSSNSFPIGFTGYQDYLLFIATTDDLGRELWKYYVEFTEPLALSIQQVSAIQCFGGTDGALSVAVTGGEEPYQFDWTPASAMGQNPSNLPAGNYTVTVTDTNGNTLVASYEITQPEQLSATTQSTPATGSQSDGTATVVANGGTPPYAYLWSDMAGSSTAMIEGVPAGDYSVTITDQNGCTITMMVTVDMETSTKDLIEDNIQVIHAVQQSSFLVLYDF